MHGVAGVKRVALGLLCFVLGQIGYWALEWRAMLEGDDDFYRVGGSE